MSEAASQSVHLRSWVNEGRLAVGIGWALAGSARLAGWVGWLAGLAGQSESRWRQTQSRARERRASRVSWPRSVY